MNGLQSGRGICRQYAAATLSSSYDCSSPGNQLSSAGIASWVSSAMTSPRVFEMPRSRVLPWLKSACRMPWTSKPWHFNVATVSSREPLSIATRSN